MPRLHDTAYSELKPALLHARIGYSVALQYCLRLRAGALMFCGLPCGSHVWISRGTSGRSQACPRGNVDCEFTSTGNEQAARLALMILLCTVRLVYWACEQPHSSLVPKLPYIEWVMNLNRVHPSLDAARLVKLCLNSNYSVHYDLAVPTGFLDVPAQLSWMGILGARSLKRTILFGSSKHVCNSMAQSYPPKDPNVRPSVYMLSEKARGPLVLQAQEVLSSGSG